MANKNTQQKGSRKGSGAAKFTYFVALLALIAGLVLPIGFKFDGSYMSNMLGWQLPAALNTVIGRKVLSFGAESFALSHEVSILGMKALTFDLGAYLTLLYGAITVIGIIWLIPVLIGKNGYKAVAKASFIEVLAMLFLVPLFIVLLFESLTLDGGFPWMTYLPLLIALGGNFLMMFFQSLIYKGSSGFMKFMMVLFSVVALLVAVIPAFFVIPALKTPYEKLAEMLGEKFSVVTLYGDAMGLTFVTLFFHSNVFEGLSNPMDMVVWIAGLTATLLVIVNLVLDVLGMGKKTNKFMLGCNIFRYLLELLAAATLIVLTFVNKYTIGLPACVLAGVAFLQFLINIIRASSYKKRVKAAKKRQAEQQKMERKTQMYSKQPTTGYANDAAAANAYLSGADDRRAAADKEREAKRKEREERRAKEQAEREAAERAEAEAMAKKRAKSDDNVYNVTQIYKGPTDEFIKELTNDEKIEFAQTFLERREAALPEIPDYIIGGNNDKFFSSIFIYFGRIRDRVSDGLMNKFYEQKYRVR